jgi:hypothetical protein
MLLLRVKHTLCQLTRSSQDVVKYNIRPIKQNNIGVLSIIISDKMKNKIYHTIEKSQKESKSIPHTQQLTFLAWYTHFNKKWRV